MWNVIATKISIKKCSISTYFLVSPRFLWIFYKCGLTNLTLVDRDYLVECNNIRNSQYQLKLIHLLLHNTFKFAFCNEGVLIRFDILSLNVYWLEFPFFIIFMKTIIQLYWHLQCVLVSQCFVRNLLIVIILTNISISYHTYIVHNMDRKDMCGVSNDIHGSIMWWGFQ